MLRNVVGATGRSGLFKPTSLVSTIAPPTLYKSMCVTYVSVWCFYSRFSLLCDIIPVNAFTTAQYQEQFPQVQMLVA